MRLRKALALSGVLLALAGPAAAAAHAAHAAGPRDIGGGAAKPAPALPSRAKAVCGDGKSAEFPIGARIRGGPAVYRSGGDAQTWYLDLTNTTRTPCTAIHPVVVFSDKTRTLRPEHLRMEFQAPAGTFPVSLERTDRDEIVAVFDGGSAFPGFAVAPGGSATVKVGLSFAAGAPTGEVVADAALVRRAADDGEWVGEAGGYRFSVEGPEQSAAPAAVVPDSLARTGAKEWAYAGAAAGALAVGGGLLLGARRLRAR
ncbi:hypothetical protein DEJ50_11895 [Streptomyces venezuelae]|uniref:Gram-positive cocci surface proteins LPxTG domain-containing protein n=1 Tax=Streptomyces venezuelae TaxID=54571 RepID=A0A5P2CZW3_STRVZ|nr:hypothetical protein [Streptomyces venezuelae]QES48415.1 hypothetical protein DEJ50_11895 [Streptomyces venezuelae]